MLLQERLGQRAHKDNIQTFDVSGPMLWWGWKIVANEILGEAAGKHLLSKEMLFIHYFCHATWTCQQISQQKRRQWTVDNESTVKVKVDKQKTVQSRVNSQLSQLSQSTVKEDGTLTNFLLNFLTIRPWHCHSIV